MARSQTPRMRRTARGLLDVAVTVLAWRVGREHMQSCTGSARTRDSGRAGRLVKGIRLVRRCYTVLCIVHCAVQLQAAGRVRSWGASFDGLLL